MESGASYDLSRQMLYLEDPDGQLTLEDVTSPAFDPDFKPFNQRGGAYNFGLTRSVYWFKLTLTLGSESPAHWLWEVSQPTLDYIDLYVPQPGGGYWRSNVGDLRPFSERPVPHKNHVIPVQLVPGHYATVYMRVASEGSYVVPVHLWKPGAFLSRGHLEYALLAGYFGILLAMMLYNLMLYVSIRDRAYLVYVGFVIGMAATQASLTGLAAEFVWGDSAGWNNHGVTVSTSLAAFFAVLFSRTFLDTRRNMPLVDKALGIILWGWVAILGASIWLSYYFILQALSSWVMVSAVVSALAGVLAYRQSRPGSRYFLMAWGVFFLAISAYGLRNLALLPSNDLTENALLMGSAAEMLLLSFALADRINVTRRQRRQEEAQRRAEQIEKENAERALAEKSRFLAAIGHDLRQPMYALGLSIDGLEHAKLTGPFAMLVPEMKSALSSIHALLDSLLFMSRLETGKVEARFSNIDAGQLLERVRLTFETQAHRKGLRFNVIPCIAALRSDPLLLERILNNLVGNALRYTDHGGILVAARRRAGGVLLQVWDTGPGIPDSQREAVFEEFFRIPRDDGDAGVGLGLGIVRNCARLIGCTVTMTSRVGRGTCFSVFVPVVGGAPGAKGETPLVQPATGSMQDMRVLIVDDEISVRRALGAALALHGCRVVAAASLQQLEERCAGAEAPDAVISDYDLGDGTNALDVTRLLRALYGSNVPVVVLTGDTSAETAALLRAARLPFLYKPAAPPEIFAMLRGIAADAEA